MRRHSGIAGGRGGVEAISVGAAEGRRIRKAELASAVYTGNVADKRDGQGRTTCATSACASLAAATAIPAVARALRSGCTGLAVAAAGARSSGLRNRAVSTFASSLGRELASDQRDRGIDAAKRNAGASALASLASEAATATTSPAATAGTGGSRKAGASRGSLGSPTATPALT